MVFKKEINNFEMIFKTLYQSTENISWSRPNECQQDNWEGVAYGKEGLWEVDVLHTKLYT